MDAIEVRTEIDAPAEQVWQMLTDFARYPDWNPLVRQLSGEMVTGRPITVRLALGAGQPMTIKPTLLRFERPTELRWRGSVLFPGIFDGEHSFVVEAIDERRSRLIHSERFSGVLTPVFRWLAAKQTERGFQAMNLALKKRIESGHAR